MTRAKADTPREATEMHAPPLSRAIGALVLVMLFSPMVAGQSFAQATFGLGTGSGTIMCSACTHAGTMGGSTLLLQVAGAVRPHLRIGGTLDTWWHSRDQWERGVWNVTAAMFYYPFEARRLFVQGGPTYSRMWATEADTSLIRHGWGFTAGLGYDIAPRSVVSFTPSLTYSYAWVGDIYYPVGTSIPFARGWKHEVVSLGLGVTLHERER